MKRGECISQIESPNVFDSRQREKAFSFSPVTAQNPPGRQRVMQCCCRQGGGGGGGGGVEEGLSTVMYV